MLERRRLIELGLAVVAVLIAGAVALFVEPLPPLARATSPSEGWARGIEFGVLVFVLWMALGAVGLIQAKISVGLDGVSAEHAQLDALSDRAAQEIREANRSLAGSLHLLAGQVEVLLDLQRQTTRRIDALYQARSMDASSGAQLDDDVDGAPASRGGAG